MPQFLGEMNSDKCEPSCHRHYVNLPVTGIELAKQSHHWPKINRLSRTFHYLYPWCWFNAYSGDIQQRKNIHELNRRTDPKFCLWWTSRVLRLLILVHIKATYPGLTACYQLGTYVLVKFFFHDDVNAQIKLFFHDNIMLRFVEP